jgi:peroxiredoxin
LAYQNCFSYRPRENKTMEIAFFPKRAMTVFPSGQKYVPQTKVVDLVVQPMEKIEIKAVLEEYYLNYRVAGSAFDEELAAGREKYKEWEISIVKLELRRDSLQSGKDTHYQDSVLLQQRVAAQGNVAEIKLDYIKHHPEKDLSAFYLLGMSPETFIRYCPTLSDAARGGILKQRLVSKYQSCQKAMAANAAAEALAVGAKAPDFTLRDGEGRMFSLSSAHSRYVVLDFWGSWCDWCMDELPRIRQYRDKYGPQITWVGIACHDHEASWKRAIRKYQLDWTQLLNSDDKDIATRYGVLVFPTKFIIDRDLKIVKIFKGGGDDFFKELDELCVNPWKRLTD